MSDASLLSRLDPMSALRGHCRLTVRFVPKADIRTVAPARPSALPASYRFHCALNDAVILQFLEQGFSGGLYYHDRWDGK